MMDYNFNYINEMTQKAAEEIREKKYALVMERVKAIDPKFDREIEEKRRFKTILLEVRDNGKREVYYYNDKTIEGHRLVTFTAQPMKLSQTPEVSTPVLFIPSNIDSEVTGPSAAVVTNVHNDTMINCQVFNDAEGIELSWRTSVQHKSELENPDDGSTCYYILPDEQE